MLVCHRNQVVEVYAFNPSPREEYKMGGNNSQTQFHSENQAESPFQTEVEIRANGCLLCFSDLRVERQLLSQVFINLATGTELLRI